MRSPTTTILFPVNRATNSRSRFTGNNVAPSFGYPGERPLDGVEEILGDMVGLDRPLLTPIFPFAAAVAGEHEHGCGAGRLSRFDVRWLVADHDRPGQVQAQLRRRAKQETRLGLSALARLPVRRLTGCRMMGAHVERVEPRPYGVQLAFELGVDGDERLVGEIASCDAGLVGRHHRGDSCGIEPRNRLWRPRQEVYPAGVVDIPPLL